MISRRTFVNGLAVGVAGSALTSTAKSYAQILGANDRLNFAINGLNGRGHAHLSALKTNSKTARVAYCLRCRRPKSSPASPPMQKKRSATPPRPSGTSARPSSPKTSTPSPSPLPITGTRLSPSSASRPASMSTSKSHPARTPAKANSSSPRRRNTESASRWATSSVPPTTPSK